jgi:hypothetical protein
MHLPTSILLFLACEESLLKYSSSITREITIVFFTQHVYAKYPILGIRNSLYPQQLNKPCISFGKTSNLPP